MKRSFIVAGIILVSLLTGAFAPQTPLQSTPTIWRQAINDSATNTFCGFPMRIETKGTGIIHVWRTSTGAVQRILITQASMKMTFTNLDNNKSVWSPTVNMQQMRYGSDGSLTKIMRGLVWRIVVPGKGVVAANVGLNDWTLKFSSTGVLLSSKLTGKHDGSIPQVLCTVLK